MTKLTQQFAKAGIVSKPSVGWTFPEQRAYQRGRFNRVKPNFCPVFNHKAEQIARAITADEPFKVLNTSAGTSSLHFDYDPDTVVRIGKVTPKGATLFPENNSALAVLGLNGNAVLAWLGAMRIVIDDKTLHPIVNDGEFIHAPIGVILACAKDCALNRDAVLAAYKGNVYGKQQG